MELCSAFLLWCFVAHYYSPWVQDIVKHLQTCLQSVFENYLKEEAR